MSVTLSVQMKDAKLVRQGLENLKADIPKIGAERIYAAMQKAQAILRKPGKRITYPVNWDSERQRRAFFATNGFGKGIPYQRTGAYNAGWYIRRNPRPSRVMDGYSLINNVPYAKYVGGSAYGAGQSKIHRNRWTLLRAALAGTVDKLRSDIEAHIGIRARDLRRGSK